MAALIVAPRQALPLLRERLRPAVPADPRRVARLIAELDSERFAVRENATRELERLGESALPALRKVLSDSPSAEVHRRVEQLLAKPAGADRLRDVRAVEALEHIGTSDAREVLQNLAKGTAEARLTREAKAALERLAKR
jgi:HEAT repeat protein